MSDLTKKLEETLTKFKETYREFRVKSYKDYDLEFAVYCGVTDIYNQYKTTPIENIIASLESEIEYYQEAIKKIKGNKNEN